MATVTFSPECFATQLPTEQIISSAHVQKLLYRSKLVSLLAGISLCWLWDFWDLDKYTASFRMHSACYSKFAHPHCEQYTGKCNS